MVDEARPTGADTAGHTDDGDDVDAETAGAGATERDGGGPLDGVLDRLDGFQRSHRASAFAYGVVKKFGDDRAGRLAALVAYYTFFSLFPLLLVLVTVLGFVLSGNEDLQEDVLDSALASYPVIGEQIRDNVGSIDGSGLALVVGIVVTLWAGLGAVTALQQAMNTVWDVPVRDWPNFVSSRVRALVMLVVLGGGTVLSALVTGSALSTAGLGALARVASVLVAFLLSTVLVLVAFLVLTSRPLGWRTVVPGALVGGAGWVVLQSIGGWIIGTRLEGASETYGTFAAVIVLLSWVYLQAQVLLLAAEINVVADVALWPRSLTGRDLTEADRRALARYAAATARHPDQEVDTSFAAAPTPTRSSDRPRGVPRATGPS